VIELPSVVVNGAQSAATEPPRRTLHSRPCPGTFWAILGSDLKRWCLHAPSPTQLDACIRPTAAHIADQFRLVDDGGAHYG